MNEKKNIQEELEEIAPFLSKIDKKNSYEVPSKYFDNLSDNILEQLQEAPKDTAKKRSWIDGIWQSLEGLFTPKVALKFAGIALLLTGAIFLLNKQETTSSIASLDQLSDEEITIYIAANIEEFEEEFFYEIEELEKLDILPENFGGEEFDKYIDEYIELDNESLDDLL